MTLDPVALEIANHRLAAIAEEMGVVLGRTALSPNIKERRDYSCARVRRARRPGGAGGAHPGASRLDAALGARRDRARADGARTTSSC